jgi:hypothetical protein
MSWPSELYDKYSNEYFFTVKKVNGSYSETCIILSNNIQLKWPKMYRVWNFVMVAFVYDRCNNLHARFWLLIGLVYLFIHSVTHVTLDTSITDYNLYITTQHNIWTSTQYNIINNNTRCKDQLKVESVTTSRYVCVCVCVCMYTHT